MFWAAGTTAARGGWGKGVSPPQVWNPELESVGMG